MFGLAINQWGSLFSFLAFINLRLTWAQDPVSFPAESKTLKKNSITQNLLIKIDKTWAKSVSGKFEKSIPFEMRLKTAVIFLNLQNKHLTTLFVWILNIDSPEIGKNDPCHWINSKFSRSKSWIFDQIHSDYKKTISRKLLHYNRSRTSL